MKLTFCKQFVYEFDTLQLWFGKNGKSAPPSAAAVISQTKCRGLLSKCDVIASSLHCLFYKCDEAFQCIISMDIITAELSTRAGFGADGAGGSGPG